MTLYLSHLLLDAREAARELNDCQLMHCTLMKAFPHSSDFCVPQVGKSEVTRFTDPASENNARAKYGVLYRIDYIEKNGSYIALVQSDVTPDWSHLPDGFLKQMTTVQGHTTATNPQVRDDVAHRYDEITEDMLLRFRLCANPTRRMSERSHRSEPKWTGKRVEIRDDEGRTAWLVRKGEQHGFRLSKSTNADSFPLNCYNLQISNSEKVFGKRNTVKTSTSNQSTANNKPELSRIRFGATVFEGELVVTDKQKFLACLVEGIGTGKAYGFGLLSVAPVR